MLRVVLVLLVAHSSVSSIDFTQVYDAFLPGFGIGAQRPVTPFCVKCVSCKARGRSIV
jgi:hypothetical protein